MTPAEWGAAYCRMMQRMVDLTLAGSGSIQTLPTVAQAPSWHALQALEVAGVTVAPGDWLRTAAFWELVGFWAAELYGWQVRDFTDECLHLANQAILEAP